jgi:NADH dehydrogenase [ubiquinone] 1 alpha subcomplex assembly factor 7
LAFGYYGALVTPLEKIITELIEIEGPMPLDRYMALCLGHPTLGYYMSRDPFGASGDFTTAPEISQLFGEMIGVWCVNSWMSLGQPSPFALVELGPGRGTLMADLLRVAKASPEFSSAMEVHMVEMSPVLQAMQREKLGDQVTWHASIESLPNMPTIFIANEFFDALPIQQFQTLNGIGYERRIGLGMKLGLVPAPKLKEEDGVYEVSPISLAIAQEIQERLDACGGAALVIDYGHAKSAAGDTLQALSKHQYCEVTDLAGEADITAHVDFEALGAGPVITQSKFLKAMGIEMRSDRLVAKLVGKERENFIAGTKRLIEVDQMGELFKVKCMMQKGAPILYPFEAA